jgi:hypothetical protein
LLATAQVAGVTCVGMIELGEHGPRVPQGDGPAANQAKAEARLDELDTRLAVLTANENSPEHIALVSVQEATPTPEPMTIEAIERDPWNAIKLDIPQDASLQLLEQASAAADHELDDLKDYIEYDREGFDDPAFQQAEAAEARIVALDARIGTVRQEILDLRERSRVWTEQTALRLETEIPVETVQTPELAIGDGGEEKDRYLQIVLDAAEPASGDAAAETPQPEQRRGRHL